MVSIPTQVPKQSPFEYTTYETRYATGSAGGKPITWGYDYVPAGTDTFEKYVEEHVRFSALVMDKERLPGIVHGRTNGYRSNEDTFSCTALVLDCDGGEQPDLALLEGVRYFYQCRPTAKKFHLVFPLAEAMTVPPLAANQVAARRGEALRFFGELLDRNFDVTTRTLAALLHPYSRRAADDVQPITQANLVAAHLDLEALLASRPYQDPLPNRARSLQDISRSEEAFGNAVLDACNELGLLKRGSSPKGRFVKCPFDDEHSTDGNDSSTLLTPTGRFICLHGHCQGRPQAEFYARLKLPVSLYALALQDHLDARKVPRVTVGEAQHQIREVFKSAQPYASSAAIVRVTTGAGKTHAAADYLDGFTAPRFDEETGDIIPGRSAILAVPTNALLREVDSRLHVDHVVAQGVLAVLNDDGSFACKKHPAAKALQEAGGDVHRLMCAKCEYRDDCAARKGARRGEGSLTLTNHALLPSIARERHESGKLPLIVWDECPPMVAVSTLTYKDIDWVLTTFEREERRTVSLETLDEPMIWGDRYRICMRPLIEVLRRIRTEKSLDAAIDNYSEARVSGSQTHRAEEFLSLRPEGSLKDRIRRVALAAKRVNVSELMFDQLADHAQLEILRAEEIGKVIDSLLEDGASVAPVLGGLRVTHLTEHGRLWKTRGGVILDATAPVAILQAIRPDCTVTDLHVRDEGKVTRLLKAQGGLSRKALALREAEGVESASVDAVVTDLRRELKTFAQALGRPAKAVAFTYRAYVAVFEEQLPDVEWHYFGNTRGYDRWFQEGYDAFITVGDPYNNIGADAAVAEYLGIDQEALSDEAAVSESAQAHGRARDPQRKLAPGARLHIHYGRLAPYGWDSNNSVLDLNYGTEMYGASHARA